MARINTPEYLIRSAVDSLIMKLRNELYGSAQSNTKLDTDLMENSVPWQWAKLDRSQTELDYHIDEKGSVHQLVFTHPQGIQITDNTAPYAFRVSQADITAVHIVSSGTGTTAVPLTVAKGITTALVNNMAVAIDWAIESPNKTLSRIESVVTDSGGITAKLVFKNIIDNSLLEQMRLEDNVLYVTDINVTDVTATGNAAIGQTLSAASGQFSSSIYSPEITLAQGDAFAGKLVICDDASGRLRFGVPEELNFEGALENVAFLNIEQSFLAENIFTSPQPGGATARATPVTLAWTGTSAGAYPGMQLVFQGEYNAASGEDFYRQAGIIHVKWEDLDFRRSSIMFEVADTGDPGTDYMEEVLKLYHTGSIPKADFYGDVELVNSRVLNTHRIKIRSSAGADKVLFSTSDGTAEWRTFDASAVPAIVRTDQENTFTQHVDFHNTSNIESIVTIDGGGNAPGLTVKNTDNTNTIESVAVFERSEGFPGVGYGGSIEFELETTGGVLDEVGSIDFTWTDTGTTKPQIDFTVQDQVALSITSDQELVYPLGATEGYVLVAGDNAGTMEWASISSVVETNLEGNIAFLDVEGGLGANEQIFTENQAIKTIFDAITGKADTPLTLYVEDKRWVGDAWVDNSLSMPDVNAGLDIRRHKGLHEIDGVPSSSGIRPGWGTGIDMYLTSPSNPQTNIVDTTQHAGGIYTKWGAPDTNLDENELDVDSEIVFTVMEGSKPTDLLSDITPVMVDALRIRHDRISIPNAGVPGSGFVLTALDAFGNAKWSPPVGSVEEGEFTEFYISGEKEDNELIVFMDYVGMDSFPDERCYAMIHTDFNVHLPANQQTEYDGVNRVFSTSGTNNIFNPLYYSVSPGTPVPSGQFVLQKVGNTKYIVDYTLRPYADNWFYLPEGGTYSIDGEILVAPANWPDYNKVTISLATMASIGGGPELSTLSLTTLGEIEINNPSNLPNTEILRVPIVYTVTTSDTQGVYFQINIESEEGIDPDFAGIASGVYDVYDKRYHSAIPIARSIYGNTSTVVANPPKARNSFYSYLRIVEKQNITDFEASALFRPYKRSLGWFIEKTDIPSTAFGPIYYIGEDSKVDSIVVNCKTAPTTTDFEVSITKSNNYTLWSNITSTNVSVAPGLSTTVVTDFIDNTIDAGDWIKLELVGGGGAADATVQILFTNK